MAAEDVDRIAAKYIALHRAGLNGTELDEAAPEAAHAHFTMVPNWVFDHLPLRYGLDAPTQAVFLHLCRLTFGYPGHEGAVAISLAQLSRRANVPKSTLALALLALEGHHLIRRERRRDASGAHGITVIHVAQRESEP